MTDQPLHAELGLFSCHKISNGENNCTDAEMPNELEIYAATK